MKYLVFISLFGLTSCGGCQRLYTKFTGVLTTKCSPNGVLILQSDSGITIARDRLGKVVPCE